MTITRKNGNGQPDTTLTLTPKELMVAFWEQQQLFDIAVVKCALDDEIENLTDTDDNLANQYSKILDDKAMVAKIAYLYRRRYDYSEEHDAILHVARSIIQDQQ